MHALVTGGSGFVGSHLVDALLKRGFDVTCTIRPTSNLRWLTGKKVRLFDRGFAAPDLSEALDGVTHVFHVAGVIQSPDEAGFMRGNRDLTRSLARACAHVPLERFVLISSLAAAGPCPGPDPVTEEDLPRPVSAYGRSKLAGEREALSIADRVPVTVIRPPVVYGPRDLGLYTLFRIARAGILPQIGARKLYSIIHVRDLIEGTLKAVFESGPDCFFITNEVPAASNTLPSRIARSIGCKAVRFHISDGTLLWLADIAALVGHVHHDKAREIVQRRWVCSASKARTRLGFRASTTLEEGLGETAAWYRRERWL
jgi:nucleoside-diphosphate-sugar epimerase